MKVTAIGKYSNFYFFICCDVLEINISVLMNIKDKNSPKNIQSNITDKHMCM